MRRLWSQLDFDSDSVDKLDTWGECCVADVRGPPKVSDTTRSFAALAFLLMCPDLKRKNVTKNQWKFASKSSLLIIFFFYRHWQRSSRYARTKTKTNSMERHELVGHGFRLQRATEKVDGALFCTKGRSQRVDPPKGESRWWMGTPGTPKAIRLTDHRHQARGYMLRYGLRKIGYCQLWAGWSGWTISQRQSVFFPGNIQYRDLTKN